MVSALSATRRVGCIDGSLYEWAGQERIRQEMLPWNQHVFHKGQAQEVGEVKVCRALCPDSL